MNFSGLFYSKFNNLTRYQNVSGLLKKLFLVSLVGLLAWAYQATRPPPPKICGTPNGPPITAPRIKLNDGRHLAYKEHGVPKEKAQYKFVYVHGFDSCRNHAVVAHFLSPVFYKSFILLTFLLLYEELSSRSFARANLFLLIILGNS